MPLLFALTVVKLDSKDSVIIIIVIIIIIRIDDDDDDVDKNDQMAKLGKKISFVAD